MQSEVNRGKKLTRRTLSRRYQTAREFLDELISSKVRLTFVTDPLMNAAAIAVATLNGTVQLSGTVRNQGERDRARLLAWTVPGVNFVRNDLVCT